MQLAPSGGAAAGGKPAPRAPARAAGEALVGRAGRRPASGAAPRAQVGGLSRALAVRTLQLEMEFMYGYLEEEALDVAQGSQAAGWLLFRQARGAQNPNSSASFSSALGPGARSAHYIGLLARLAAHSGCARARRRLIRAAVRRRALRRRWRAARAGGRRITWRSCCGRPRLARRRGM